MSPLATQVQHIVGVPCVMLSLAKMELVRPAYCVQKQ